MRAQASDVPHCDGYVCWFRRWDRVSEVVPGKSKAQCFKRFKEMREAFRAKKGGAGGDDGDE